ncbi:hypothetical protein [Falsiroseomonas sp. HW251]|uniref:hypothetical protein n=1 Tax=Falsiroseomonas sp. HW251 TaxID=3390998 RepID=UPI003D32112E
MSVSRDDPENTRTMLLMAGTFAAVLGYVMPAIVFKGTGNAVHDLSIIEKLPVLSAIAFLALTAALATRFVPSLRRWAETATVLAIVLTVAPALWGFVSALDAWSSLRAMIQQIAGTRNIRIDPGPAYLPLLAGAGMLALSLRGSARRDQAAKAA